MPSITRRKAATLLTGVIALGAVGGAVAKSTRKDSPHLIVNNQTETELAVTTIIRTGGNGEVVIDDTTSVPATDEHGYTGLAANEPLDVTIRTGTGLENTYRWERTEPENALSIGITTDDIGFVVATPP